MPVVISTTPGRIQPAQGTGAVICRRMETPMENRMIYPPSRVIVSKLFIMETSIRCPMEAPMEVSFFCAGDAIVIRQWCFQSGRMFFLSAQIWCRKIMEVIILEPQRIAKVVWYTGEPAEYWSAHRRSETWGLALLENGEKIFRFFPGDFFLSIKLSGQSGSHGITAEKPQKESIHSVSIQPQKMPAEPFKMPQKAGNHPCMDQEIR